MSSSGLLIKHSLSRSIPLTPLVMFHLRGLSYCAKTQEGQGAEPGGGADLEFQRLRRPQASRGLFLSVSATLS